MSEGNGTATAEIAGLGDKIATLTLVQAGELGSLGTNFYSFLGAQRTYDGILQESGPDVARKLREDDVDVVFLTGA